jgi:hypothetical protein
MKTTLRALAIVAALIIIVASSARSQSIETLQTSCAQKTLMYNIDAVKIGERLDDYCRGFLEGTFTAMQRAKLICPEHPPDGNVLLSVFSTYATDQKLKGVDAAEAVAAAYQRAFPCKK